MKIFNWVHRKFRQSAEYHIVSHQKDGFIETHKGLELFTLENETDALLLDPNALVDVFDNWQEGILSIGTFGFDPLKPLQSAIKEPGSLKPFKKEDTEEQSHMISLNPLVEEIESLKSNVEGKLIEIENPETDAAIDINPFFQIVESEIVDEIDEGKKKKVERKTLADLFSAEAVSGKSKQFIVNPSNVEISSKKLSSRTKKSFSIARKLAGRKETGSHVPSKMMDPVVSEKNGNSHKGKDSPSTAKIQRLVTKMLKRKIHPELEKYMDDGVTAVNMEPCFRPSLEESRVIEPGTSIA